MKGLDIKTDSVRETHLACDEADPGHRQAVVDFFENRFSWWERVYGDDLPRGFFSYEMNRRKEMVLTAVNDFIGTRTGLNILECGCGPGGVLQDLPSLNNQVVGTDINYGYLTQMHSANTKASGLCCDIEAMPFADGSFDLLICVGVLPYLQQDGPAIVEMSRLLKPEGRLILSNPSYYMLDKFLDPYYYLYWPFRQVSRFFKRSKQAGAKATGAFSSAKIRRYHLQQLDPLFKSQHLIKTSELPVSFGPIKVWKKEVLKIDQSIWLSRKLISLAERKIGRFLVRVANHRVTCLVKSSPQGEVQT